MKSHDQAWEPCFRVEEVSEWSIWSTRAAGWVLTCWTHHVLCGGRRTVCILAEEEAGDENLYAWGHHTHKHMLHIAMATSISSRRVESCSFFFCFLFSSEAFRFGKWDISYEEILSKRKIQKQNLLLSEDDSHSYKILMQNLNHNSPFGLWKKWLMGNIHISCFQTAYPPSSHSIKINSRSNECHWSWLQYSVLD